MAQETSKTNTELKEEKVNTKQQSLGINEKDMQSNASFDTQRALQKTVQSLTDLKPWFVIGDQHHFVFCIQKWPYFHCGLDAVYASINCAGATDE